MIYLKRKFLLIVLFISFCHFAIATRAFASDEPYKFAIDAFLKLPEVSKALNSLKKEGYYETHIEIVKLAFTCGVAGCNSDVLLVVQQMETKEKNKTRRSVLGYVMSDVRSQTISSVKLVTLKGVSATESDSAYYFFPDNLK